MDRQQGQQRLDGRFRARVAVDAPLDRPIDAIEAAPRFGIVDRHARHVVAEEPRRSQSRIARVFLLARRAVEGHVALHQHVGPVGDLSQAARQDADLTDALERKLAQHEGFRFIGRRVDPVLPVQRRARFGQRVDHVAAPGVPVAGRVGRDRVHAERVGGAVAQHVLADPAGDVLDQRLRGGIRVRTIITGQRQHHHRGDIRRAARNPRRDREAVKQAVRASVVQHLPSQRLLSQQVGSLQVGGIGGIDAGEDAITFGQRPQPAHRPPAGERLVAGTALGVDRAAGVRHEVIEPAVLRLHVPHEVQA